MRTTKSFINVVTLAFWLIVTMHTMSAYATVVVCEVEKTNGGGFTTTVESVVDNCDDTHTIVLRVEHNGCGGPSCKELSHYAVEADPGTYSNVSVEVISGQMTYQSIEMGPNLGVTPFQGFKIDGIKKIGGGRAGVFTITYTLDGGLQDQQTSAKAGNSAQLAAFLISDFEFVMNCAGTGCDESTGLNGNVFHDINGLTDNTVNGNGIGSINGEALYANLLSSENLVLNTVAVGSNGTYTFEVAAGSYTVQLSINQGSIGSAAPITELPENWVNTGEFVGTTAGNDNNIDGFLATIVVSGAYTENVNFGIQMRPTAETNTASEQENPGGTISVTVDASIFIAADEDGDVTSIRISSFPLNATSITINGTLYTENSFPAQGIIVPATTNGNPTQTISVDPVDGVVTVSIPFYSIDNAGFESLVPGSANVPFTVIGSFGGLSGNLFHDINGMTDNTVNGTAIGSAENTVLYANLLNGSQVVLASVQLNNNGSYEFNNLPNATYIVQISTVAGEPGQAAPASTLPDEWVNTGEFVGITEGNDGNPDGLLQAIVADNLMTVNVNFGIEKRPIAGTATATIQENPGGEIFVTVPPATFIYSDTDGIVTSIRLVSFPVNATAIMVGESIYTAANFPVSGITIPVENESLGLITKVDPIDGAVTVPIPFKTKDNAGFESTLNGNAYVPFSGEYFPIDNFFPANGYGTLAFEDLWPGQGDYDFNDLVIDYQFELISNVGNYVDQIKGKFIIKAFGASYENGFGFQLSSNIDPEDLYVEGSSITEGYVTLANNGVEAGQSKPTIIVYDNAYNEMEYPGVGIGVNTELSAPYVDPVELEIRIYLPANTYTFAQVDIANFNPFIIVNQNRGIEVHLPNYPPTDLVDNQYFGIWDDNSNPTANRWYVNDKNLPWAIHIYESFAYPIEKQVIIGAHLKFAEWAMSSGLQFPDWYKNLSGYRNNDLIYPVPVQD